MTSRSVWHSPAAMTRTSTSAPRNSRAVTVSIFDLLTPTPPTGGGTCSNLLSGAQTLWATVDFEGDGVPDYFNSLGFTVDTKAPTLPTDFSALPSDGGIQISFTPPADTSDILYYQAFCSDASGQPVRTTTTCDPDDTDATKLCARYVRPVDLCGVTEPVSPMTGVDIAVSSTDNVDASTTAVDVPEGVKTADPAFLCGVNGTQTASSIQLTGLTNGTPYTVSLVAVDPSGNYQGVFFNQTITPQPVTDLWQDIHDRNGKAQGGFCLLESTYGDDSGITNAMRSFRDHTLADTAFGRWLTDVYYATIAKLGPTVQGSLALRIVFAVLLFPLVAIAMLWHWLSLPGLLALIAGLYLLRRYRHRIATLKLATAGALVAAMVLAPGRARADDVEPYWKTESVADDETQSLAGMPVVKWHVGVRIGPYTPGIDKQVGGPSPGPYAAMFGTGFSVLPMLDVDRILWDGFGQVGVGISLGFMSKKDHPYVKGTSSLDMNPMRSPGDTNTFRLFPVSVSAVYRFTYLDDEFGVPIVPYARAGLAYYIWYMKTNDHLSRVCKDGSDISDNPGCETDKAEGASLGVVGSIGLAIRAERIDSTAAKSMQQSGLEHAGIFGEVSFGKVDGFGSQTKLSVGDTTWFAGVDFEF